MPRRNLIWMAAVLAAALVALFLTRPSRQSGDVSSPREFDPVREAYHTIGERYLYPLEDNHVRRGAIGGMVAQLDEFSTYIPPDRAEAFADRMGGLAWGLGLKVEASDGEVVVVGPLAGSPAQQCGLLRGDRILQIDGHGATKLSQAAVEDLLDGPPQAAVAITVRRAAGNVETVLCRRGKFALETVQGLYRSPAGEWVFLTDPTAGLGYLRVREILPTTPDQLRGALRQMDRLRALVLDLRDNPGGDLQAAVELANMFIPSGPLVSVVDRGGRTDHVAYPAHAAVPPEVELVALVNARTASAAEMVAGALAYRDRAVLVGQRTRGKGCIQSMIPLEGEMGRLNLTTAEFFVDPLRPIQRRKDSNEWGVDPHWAVEVPPAIAGALASLRAKAEVLQPSRGTTRPSTGAAEDDDPGALLPRLDPQLRQAVSLAGDPVKMRDLLRHAAVARAAAKTRPATTTRPGATQGAEAK
jgi:carboxyl-terminal processing protease